MSIYQDARDKYMPNAPIWLTETTEIACGGNPMATTYIDTFRYLEQLGRLTKKGVQVVMHNTLARNAQTLEKEILDFKVESNVAKIDKKPSFPKF